MEKTSHKLEKVFAISDKALIKGVHKKFSKPKHKKTILLENRRLEHLTKEDI